MSGRITPAAPAERQRLTWQKVILGDWSKWIRDPHDVARIAFACAVIIWGLAGKPVTQVLGAALVLLVARAVSLPRFYDFSLIVVMLLLAWGEVLGLYDSWGMYDDVVHFTVPLLTTGMLYLLLMRLDMLPELSALTQPHHRVGVLRHEAVPGHGDRRRVGDRRVHARLADRIEPPDQRLRHVDRPHLRHARRWGKRDHPAALEPRRPFPQTASGRRSRRQGVHEPPSCSTLTPS
jgi:hypothetical protein